MMHQYSIMDVSSIKESLQDYCLDSSIVESEIFSKLSNLY